MKKTMRRLTCLMIALCFALPMTRTGAENVDDMLAIGILANRTNEIRPLNPQDRDMISLYGLVYESLVTIDDEGLPQPLLAETWQDTDGGKTWTFTLREGVKFSDGTALTASDVEASCRYLLQMARDSNAPSRGFYQNIRYLVDSVTALDARTLEVKALRPYYGLLYIMTFPVVHASQVDVASPLGTGPYMFTAFEPTNHIRLDVNPQWWQNEPQVKTITAKCYPNSTDLINGYEINEVSTVFTRSVASAQYKSGISSLSIPYQTRQLEAPILNYEELPLESLKIRQAIRYAINVPLISQDVFMGMTVKANTPLPSSSWLHYDQESAYEYNPQKAAELLAEEGWADTDNDGVLNKMYGENKRNLRLRLYVYEDPENDVRFETADRIADMLGALKINVAITHMTYEEQLKELEAGTFDMALCAFQMDVVPDAGFFLHKANQQNYGSYRSDDMSTLIDELRKQRTRDDFFYASQAIQQKFAEDIPFICLFYRSGAILTRKMYSTVRTFREYELLRGIEAFGR